MATSPVMTSLDWLLSTILCYLLTWFPAWAATPWGSSRSWGGAGPPSASRPPSVRCSRNIGEPRQPGSWWRGRGREREQTAPAEPPRSARTQQWNSSEEFLQIDQRVTTYYIDIEENEKMCQKPGANFRLFNNRLFLEIQKYLLRLNPTFTLQ